MSKDPREMRGCTIALTHRFGLGEMIDCRYGLRKTLINFENILY